jgi:hypothetical protein
MVLVKKYYKNKIDNIIKNDPDLAENILLDNNNISKLIQVNAWVKISKLVVIIFNLIYILGAFFHIFYFLIDKAKNK